jgi:predicted regulator of Ras-like GTPase activity (Roadblock/LC7/MglB family)
VSVLLASVARPMPEARTPFAVVLRDVVKANPNAIGAAFAASDGEMVDSFCTTDEHEWAVLTAHYGIVMAHINSCFNTWHYGGPEHFIAQHGKLDIIVHAVDAGYFGLIAIAKPANLGIALKTMRVACAKLKKEMS